MTQPTAGSTTDLEHRSWPGEIRAESKDGARILRGYAAVYGQPSGDFGGWHEVVERGAFRSAFESGADVLAFWGHDSTRPLGRTLAGTLRLQDDARGLFVEITVPDTTAGKDALESVRRGDVAGMSFGFRVNEGGARWESLADGTERRVLTDVRLFEVSPVAIPAYPDTTIMARSRGALPQGDTALYSMRLKLLDLQARAAGI